MKRGLDLFLILITAPLWIPLLALTWLLTLIFMRRPTLFTQERAGKNGVPFRLRKFRTMRLGDAPDAERLTRFGRFLRASSLDELPELWNVIRGEMSLVGPRPLPVRYLPRYTKEQNRRHEITPGITGWAQVHGRNSLDWDTKFRYDVEYVDTHSLWLDLKIIAMTVAQMIRPRHIAHNGEATMNEFTGDSLLSVQDSLRAAVAEAGGAVKPGLG